MLKTIHCPFCKMRLFDAKEDAKGRIEIKCTRCGKIAQIELKEIELKTIEQKVAANG